MAKTTRNRFSPEVRHRAVRMVLDHGGDHASQWSTIGSIAAKNGPAPYYTFNVRGTPGRLLKQWRHIKARASDALLAAGGTITHHELTAERLGTGPLEHAPFQDVQLGLAHRALEAEQQAIVVGARVVKAVRIRDECVKEGAGFEQLVPVTA